MPQHTYVFSEEVGGTAAFRVPANFTGSSLRVECRGARGGNGGPGAFGGNGGIMLCNVPANPDDQVLITFGGVPLRFAPVAGSGVEHGPAWKLGGSANPSTSNGGGAGGGGGATKFHLNGFLKVVGGGGGGGARSPDSAFPGTGGGGAGGYQFSDPGQDGIATAGTWTEIHGGGRASIVGPATGGQSVPSNANLNGSDGQSAASGQGAGGSYTFDGSFYPGAGGEGYNGGATGARFPFAANFGRPGGGSGGASWFDTDGGVSMISNSTGGNFGPGVCIITLDLSN